MRIADQVAEQHGNRTTISLRIDIPPRFVRPTFFVSKQVTAAATIALSRLVGKAASLAEYGQRSAAGRTESASRPVLKFAFCAPQSIELRFFEMMSQSAKRRKEFGAGGALYLD